MAVLGGNWIGKKDENGFYDQAIVGENSSVDSFSWDHLKIFFATGKGASISNTQTHHLTIQGTIINLPDLVKEFDLSEDVSTAEVIYTGFAEKGMSVLTKLEGSYLITLLNKETGTLYIIQDKYASYPVFYTNNRNNFAFSTSLNGIKNCIGPAIEQEKLGVEDALRFGFTLPPFTLYKGIEELKPGNYIQIDANGIQLLEYWNPIDARSPLIATTEGAKIQVKNKLKSYLSYFKNKTNIALEVNGQKEGMVLANLYKELFPNQELSIISTIPSMVEVDVEFAESLGYSHLSFDLTEIKETSINTELPTFGNYWGYSSSLLENLNECGIVHFISAIGGKELFTNSGAFEWIPRLKSKNWLTSFPPEFRTPMAKINKLFDKTRHKIKVADAYKEPYFDMEYLYQHEPAFNDSYDFSGYLKHSPEVNSVFTSSKELVGYGTPGFESEELAQLALLELLIRVNRTKYIILKNLEKTTGVLVYTPYFNSALLGSILSFSNEILETPTLLSEDNSKKTLETRSETTHKGAINTTSELNNITSLKLRTSLKNIEKSQIAIWKALNTFIAQ